MSDSEIQSTVYSLLERLSRAADGYIRGAVARNASFLPGNVRAGADEAADRLATVLDALFEVQALCVDAAVVDTMAKSQRPFGDVSSYQSKRMFEAYRLHLEAAFSTTVSRLAVAYNATLQAISADEEQIDLDQIMQTAGGRCEFLVMRHDERAALVDAETQHRTLSETDRWPRQWPARETISDREHSELLLQLQQQRECMRTNLAMILELHGPALLEIIHRHNAMMQNFERLSRG